MNLPPLGLTVPVTFVPGKRDGDTPVVRLRTGQECAVRLIDCWCPETNQAGGIKARDYLWELLGSVSLTGELITLHVPLPRDRNEDGLIDITELLAGASFDRVPGRLFVGSKDVSEMMVASGHATKERPDK